MARLIKPLHEGRYGTLRRTADTPAWLAIGWRMLAVLALIGLAIAVHWFDKEGLRDTYDGDVSFLDIVYFTMISISTTGYGDIAPGDRAGAHVRRAGGDPDPHLRRADLRRQRV